MESRTCKQQKLVELDMLPRFACIMNNSSFIKPFVAGALTALSTAWIVQRAWRQQAPSSSRRTHHTLREDVVFDSPHLEERIIRKAEAAIQGRTSRLVVVIERCTNDWNHSAILRTCEALGIQHVYIIDPPKQQGESTKVTSAGGKVVKNLSVQEEETRALHHLYAQRATEWLDIHEFETTSACLQELRSERYTIWATDLSQQAACLTEQDLKESNVTIPEKLAIVFGTEAVGCTHEMLQECDLRVYLPLRGFADSLNLSVATALVIQQLFILDPSLIGAMSESERRELRQEWFAKLAQQRLLTSSQKKHKVRLENKLKKCQDLISSQEKGIKLTPQQLVKLNEMPILEQELNVLNQEVQLQAQFAVQDLVDHPPSPISDMRRADEHRTCYVGKGTKARNSENWNGMPATTSYQTNNHTNSSAVYFRNKAESGTKQQQE